MINTEVLTYVYTSFCGLTEGEPSPKFRKTNTGVNNFVYYVFNNSDVPSHVVRIYNNSGDVERVRSEHEVLQALRKLPSPTEKNESKLIPNIAIVSKCGLKDFFCENNRINTATALSFNIPAALLDLNTSLPYIKLSTGTYASVFDIIPGRNPKISCVDILGAAAGELNRALSFVKLSNIPPTPPYHDLWKAHPSITREYYYHQLSSEAFDSYRVAADFLLHTTLALEQSLDGLHSLGLPWQLIHGDLNYENFLVQDTNSDTVQNYYLNANNMGVASVTDGVIINLSQVVTGIVDFEFIAWDWRVMELAVALSKYAAEPDPLPYFELFIRNYIPSAVPLSTEEVEAVPVLIVLRLISNVAYFLGRALAGEDALSTLTSRLQNYQHRIEWIQQHSDHIRGIIRTSQELCAINASR